MTHMLAEFAPGASEAVRLAVRCQHLRRWLIPREAYPRNREGYRAWRTKLARFHAETAAGILRAIGYPETMVFRVGALLRKERLATDPEAQLVEDVAALVFIRHYLGRFVIEHPEHDAMKVARILARTLRKMSPRAREAALGALDRLPRNDAVQASESSV